jgi:hypothetical protein
MIQIQPSHKGLFHRDVGKSPGAKITSSDIAKGKASSDPAERKRATFAANARKWKKGSKKKVGETNARHSAKLYGAK